MVVFFYMWLGIFETNFYKNGNCSYHSCACNGIQTNGNKQSQSFDNKHSVNTAWKINVSSTEVLFPCNLECLTTPTACYSELLMTFTLQSTDWLHTDLLIWYGKHIMRSVTFSLVIYFCPSTMCPCDMEFCVCTCAHRLPSTLSLTRAWWKHNVVEDLFRLTDSGNVCYGSHPST